MECGSGSWVVCGRGWVVNGESLCKCHGVAGQLMRVVISR